MVESILLIRVRRLLISVAITSLHFRKCLFQFLNVGFIKIPRLETRKQFGMFGTHFFVKPLFVFADFFNGNIIQVPVRHGIYYAAPDSPGKRENCVFVSEPQQCVRRVQGGILYLRRRSLPNWAKERSSRYLPIQKFQRTRNLFDGFQLCRTADTADRDTGVYGGHYSRMGRVTRFQEDLTVRYGNNVCCGYICGNIARLRFRLWEVRLSNLRRIRERRKPLFSRRREWQTRPTRRRGMLHVPEHVWISKESARYATACFDRSS